MFGVVPDHDTVRAGVCHVHAQDKHHGETVFVLDTAWREMRS